MSKFQLNMSANEIWELCQSGRLSGNKFKISKYTRILSLLARVSCSVDFESLCIAWVSVWDCWCWVEFSVSGFSPEGSQAVSRNTQSTHPELSVCLLLSPCPPSHRSCGEEHFQWRCRKTYPLLSALPQRLYRTSIFPSAHLHFVSFFAFLLTLTLSVLRTLLCHFSHESNKSRDSSLSKWCTSPCPDGCL